MNSFFFFFLHSPIFCIIEDCAPPSIELDAHVFDVQFHPHHNVIASTLIDGRVLLWELATFCSLPPYLLKLMYNLKAYFKPFFLFFFSLFLHNSRHRYSTEENQLLLEMNHNDVPCRGCHFSLSGEGTFERDMTNGSSILHPYFIHTSSPIYIQLYDALPFFCWCSMLYSASFFLLVIELYTISSNGILNQINAEGSVVWSCEAHEWVLKRIKRKHTFQL